MRRLAALVALACLVLACSSAPPAPARFPVSELLGATVALTDAEGDPRCAGVWIGPARILTAAHCLEGLEDSPPSWLPYRAGPHAAMRLALVLKVDAGHDLALLIDPDAPPHPAAWVASTPPSVGEPIDIVGHPAGLEWTYCHGWVAASRGDLLQVSAPVFFGNSGGGAFARDGSLVGIAHTLQVARFGPSRVLVPDVAFFVGVDAMREFLGA